MMNLARIIILIAVTFIGGTASFVATYDYVRSQPSDPCEGVVPEGQVGLNYEGQHCILVEPEKGPVQGILVRRVEDLDTVEIYGIIVAHTESGWRILDEEFVSDIDGRQFAKSAVGDGWHMELDPIEESPSG